MYKAILKSKDNLEKTEYTTKLLELLGFRNTLVGSKYLSRLIAVIWKDKNDCWVEYDRYITIISKEFGKQEYLFISGIKHSLTYNWRRGNHELIKMVFGYSTKDSNAPTWTLFLRTIIAILFYCDENKIDAVELLNSLKTLEFNDDIKLKNIMTGYMVMLLKKIALSDAEIDKSTLILDDTLKNSSFGEAFITYIKYKSPLFVSVVVEDIVIPPQLHNRTIWDLDYDNRQTAVKVGNALCRSGVYQLKDLRYKSSEDIQNTRNIGVKSYECFINALRKTIQSQVG